MSPKATIDPVKRAEFYRSLTVTGLARTARDEYDAILDRFGTTRVRTRARRSSLLVSRWDKYNPEEFKLGKVWSRDTQSAFVVCRQGEGARLRFLLKLEDEGWRLELKQTLDATAKKVESTHEIWH